MSSEVCARDLIRNLGRDANQLGNEVLTALPHYGVPEKYKNDRKKKKKSRFFVYFEKVLWGKTVLIIYFKVTSFYFYLFSSYLTYPVKQRKR